MIGKLKNLQTAWMKLSPANRWRIVLGGVAILLLVSLLLSTKPWDVQGGKLRHTIAIHTWYGKAFSFAAISVLAILAPWWARPIEKRIEVQKSNTATPRWFWPLVFAAMALAACFSFPRLGYSLWDDEELCARHSLVGKFRFDEKNGQIGYSPLKWDDTFFGYVTPNNHVLFSIASRLSSTAVNAVTPEAELRFRESALRLPAYLFGILSIAALAWFLKQMGFAGAGVVAAFLLALHPWHIRYTSEARGYSLILLLVPLLYAFWNGAVRTGEWKWWAACAAAQFALIYTYPGILFLLVVLNALSLPALALARDAARPFFAQSGRWFFTNSCAALLAVLLMLPLIPQARNYFDHESAREIVLGWSWVRSTLSFMLAGVPWAGANEYIALGHLNFRHPHLLQAFVVCTVGLLAAGTVAFARRSLLHTCIAIVIFATPILTFLLSRVRKMLIYESYTIYALPGLVALVAIGIVAVCQVVTRLPAGRYVGPAAAAVMILLYAAVTWDFRGWLITHPLQQFRESVLLCRPVLDPLDSRQTAILTGSFCIPPYLYDPHARRLDSVDQFVALMKESDQSGKPLYINIGMPWAAREYSPRLWQIFNDDRLFENRRELLGFDAGLDRQVAKYKPGSAATFDFSALPGATR
jgi:hypothetical protein